MRTFKLMPSIQTFWIMLLINVCLGDLSKPRISTSKWIQPPFCQDPPISSDNMECNEAFEKLARDPCPAYIWVVFEKVSCLFTFLKKW